MDIDGNLVSAHFDFNNELGGGTSYKYMFNDGTVSDRTWGKYLEKLYKSSEEQPTKQLQPRGVPMELEVDDNGEPVLPIEASWPSNLTGQGMISWQKQLLRSFLGAHYGMSSIFYPSNVY